MLTVTKFYARSFDLDRVDLFWEIEDFDGNILQYDFYVLRSESPAGPFEILVGPFQDRYYFRDAKPTGNLHKHRNLYYKLRIVEKPTSKVKEFGPTAQLAEMDLIALEIQRQEDMLFREHIGRMCWVFPVKTFGARCLCFDRNLGRRTRSNCPTCYDVGFLGGYLSPIECFIQFDPNAKETQLTSHREEQPEMCVGRLISFPPLKPKDIVVEAENIRWRVVRVPSTQRLRAIVHQEPQFKRIEPGDIEYKLPINISDLKALSLTGERNFTSPQHCDDETDISNTLAIFGYRPRGTVR